MYIYCQKEFLKMKYSCLLKEKWQTRKNSYSKYDKVLLKGTRQVANLAAINMIKFCHHRCTMMIKIWGKDMGLYFKEETEGSKIHCY